MSSSPADLCHPMIPGAPFTREGWIFELKHDGFRTFARTGAQPELRSRWGCSLSDVFPEILHALAGLPDAALDGELIVPDGEGRSDVEMLRRRSLMRRPREVARMCATAAAVLVVFDVLEARGRDMRSLPLQERRDWLGVHARTEPGCKSSSMCERMARPSSARSRRTITGHRRQAGRRSLRSWAAVDVAEDQKQRGTRGAK